VDRLSHPALQAFDSLRQSGLAPTAVSYNVLLFALVKVRPLPCPQASKTNMVGGGGRNVLTMRATPVAFCPRGEVLTALLAPAKCGELARAQATMAALLAEQPPITVPSSIYTRDPHRS
jgi:hypothetical protein